MGYATSAFETPPFTVHCQSRKATLEGCHYAEPEETRAIGCPLSMLIRIPDMSKGKGTRPALGEVPIPREPLRCCPHETVGGGADPIRASALGG